MIIYQDVEQGSVEWHAMRNGLWTGSKAIDLMLGKKLKEDHVWGGNDATRRGHSLEIIAIAEYQRKYGTTVQRPGFVTNTVYTNAGYSPDGIDGTWLLEVKAFSGERHEDLVRGKIPLKVLTQIYFGMIITGKRKARLIAINPDSENYFVIREIPYDKKIGANIRKKLRADMKNRRLLS